MANAFTASATVLYGGMYKQDRVVREGTLVIDTTALGGATKGDLPASMFGLRKITRVSNILLNDNSKIIPAAPANDGSSLMVGGGTSSAAADLANGTYILTIEGTL